ncbi:MAG: metal-dependent hydrolase [Candidatus Micrarchaeota archaeon]
MQGKTHLFCASMYLGAAAFMAFKAGCAIAFDPLLFLLASIVAVQFPDVDAPNKKSDLNGLFQIPALITKYLLFIPISLLLLIMGKKGAEHRGIMHSLKGLLLVLAFWLMIGILALNYFSAFNNLRLLLLLVLGVLCGYLFHLWQDALTVSGVQFSTNLKIRGWLRTGKHEWLMRLFFLIISAVAANLANTGDTTYAAAVMVLALPLSFLFFGKA